MGISEGKTRLSSKGNGGQQLSPQEQLSRMMGGKLQGNGLIQAPSLANQLDWRKNTVKQVLPPPDARGRIKVEDSGAMGEAPESWWTWEPGEVLSGWLLKAFHVPEPGKAPRVAYKLERAPYIERTVKTDPETGAVLVGEKGEDLYEEKTVTGQVVCFSERYKLRKLKLLPGGTYVEIMPAQMVETGPNREVRMFDIEADIKLSRGNILEEPQLFHMLNAEWQAIQAMGGPYNGMGA